MFFVYFSIYMLLWGVVFEVRDERKSRIDTRGGSTTVLVASTHHSINQQYTSCNHKSNETDRRVFLENGPPTATLDVRKYKEREYMF